MLGRAKGARRKHKGVWGGKQVKGSISRKPQKSGKHQERVPQRLIRRAPQREEQTSKETRWSKRGRRESPRDRERLDQRASHVYSRDGCRYKSIFYSGNDDNSSANRGEML